MGIKTDILNNAKNVIGWKTDRKIVVISVDDYGNVRLDSKEAAANLEKAGIKPKNRFDRLDTLETKEDLEALYEVLMSVKDKNGNPAVFTPFAMPCNINFEKMREEGFTEYHYELLPETLAKLKGYEGVWDLWQEGLRTGIMVPQFHGREHLNLKVFKEKLAKRDPEVLTALNNRTYTSISSSGYSTISYTAAFEFWDMKENEAFTEIITDGLNAFEKVYGYRSIHFNPPGGREHHTIHKVLKDNGVKYIDSTFIRLEHQGQGKYKKTINFTGSKNQDGLIIQVRNVVFEPTDNRGFNWVDYSLKQVEAAFRWKKPAIISSHRVNFCGHIDENNRKEGLDALKKLLQKIVERWPDVEFMSSADLGKIISESKYNS